VSNKVINECKPGVSEGVAPVFPSKDEEIRVALRVEVGGELVLLSYPFGDAVVLPVTRLGVWP
jgi:hypothetical protein